MTDFTINDMENISSMEGMINQHTKMSLIRGVETNNIDLIRCSLDNNVDASSIKYDESLTLIHFAVIQNNVEIVNILLPYTKNLNVFCANTKTPLFLAVEKNCEAYNKVEALKQEDNYDIMKAYEDVIQKSQQIIESLINAGAEIYVGDEEWNNPIFFAISQSNIPLFNYLLQQNFSKDPQNVADILNFATRLNKKEIVEILLDTHKINVNIENMMGITPLKTAIERGHISMVEFLLEKGANFCDGNYCVTQKLSDITLKETSEDNQESENNEETILSANETLVPENIKQKVIECTVETRSNSTESLEEKEPRLTPLHVAVQYNKLEIAKILIKHGANPDVMINKCYRYSPLLIAISNNYNEMAELLLRNGADPNETVNFMGLSSCYIMHCVVLKGNLKIVKMLVDNGAKVNMYDKNGYSPLGLAIYLRKQDIIDYLLNIGAFINSPDSKFQPIHLAVIGNDLETVKKLINYGAELEVIDVHGKTALYLAVENNYFAIAQYLLVNKANVNVIFKCDDVEAFTPLHVATINNNIQLVTLLLNHGARCRSEISPIYLAIANGNDKIFSIFWSNRIRIEGADSINYWNRNNLALHWAIHHDQPQMVEMLFNYGADLNAPDEAGYTPLFRAILKYNSLIVKYLVKEGAIINEPCLANKYRQWMPIHLVAYIGNLHWMKFFVEYGASVHATTGNHLCPLWLAVKRGHADVVKFLLEHKADVQCRNISRYNNFDTPLHLAVQSRRFDIIKLLIRFKANINCENNNKQSPLALAIRGSDPSIVKFLLRNNAKIHTVSTEMKLAVPNLNIAVALNEKQLVEILLHNGASVDEVDKDGKTPLAVAIERGYLRIVKYLLKSEANANVAYRLDGKVIVRPLFLAISGRHKKIVAELLKHPIDINASLNNENYTPLLFASYLGYTEIVEILLHNMKINFNAVDINGMSALHHAIKNDHNELALLLIEYGVSVELKDIYGKTPIDYCKDGTALKFHKWYSIKEQCLKLNDKEFIIFIINEIHDSDLNNLIDMCLNEIARLKQITIVGITLYRLLTMSNEEIQEYFNELTNSQIHKLAHYLKLKKVKASFPSFINMLRRKMIRYSS